jgi:hypothetical protein
MQVKSTLNDDLVKSTSLVFDLVHMNVVAHQRWCPLLGPALVVHHEIPLLSAYALSCVEIRIEPAWRKSASVR